MDNTQQLPTVLSLCSGYGGIEIGLERALGKINVLAHVEIEAYADANMVAKMETGQLVPAPLWTNLKTLRPEIFRNKVDILTGGYPCQPFSNAGKRAGKDDPRHLWPWIREIIKGVRPGLCFFENVEGHISLGLREVLTDLVKLEYRVENDCGEPTWGLFSAAEVGAPHQRKRVFILAYSPDSNGWLTETRLHNAPIWESSSRRIGPAGIELANARSPELNRIPEPEERREDRTVGESGAQWPARPGQPQFEWEEPRVVDSKSAIRRRSFSEDNPRGRLEETGGSNRTDGQDSKTQPCVGRTINGPGSRVDRLRLLGNGVCPDTAEKAFRTLYGRIINPDENRKPIEIQTEMFA